MKKTTLTTAFLLVMACSVFAQEGVKFGLKVNPIFSFAQVLDSNKTKIPDLKTNARVGYEFGLMITYGFTETVGLGFGAEINSRGFVAKQEVADPLDASNVQTLKTTQGITTLELPLYLKLRSPEIGTGIYVVGNVGATADINISNRLVSDAWVVAVDTGGVPISSQVVNSTDANPKRVNIFTATPFIGAGVDWEFDWGTIEMMVSYHHGLMNVWRKKFEANNKSIVRLSYVGVDIAYFF